MVNKARKLSVRCIVLEPSSLSVSRGFPREDQHEHLLGRLIMFYLKL